MSAHRPQLGAGCTGSSRVTQKWARAALAHPAFTGVSRQHLGCLIEELAGPWSALREAALYARRGHKRLRAAGAGPKQELVFTDRVALTLVHLRTHLPHAAPAELIATPQSARSSSMPTLVWSSWSAGDCPGIGTTPGAGKSPEPRPPSVPP